ncbi:MAG: ATP-binding protein [Muribaculaceae bacterium]|nr:ATP-binding protein [Muribaculaceae bacterium]
MKYPIGIQSFTKLREEGFVYVDKTGFLLSLIKNPGYYFLSRPRRFGKSLLLSTLHAYYTGRRDLFKGLALDTDEVDWTPSAVIHFDFNTENFQKEDGLDNLLESLLSEYEEKYNVTATDKTPARRFATLIRRIYEQTGRKVVILVDEYDKPLLGIEDNKQLFEKNQATLKGFFGNLKSMDSYIELAFLTGVARFNKVSIFSDLNNLNDISLSNEYADICGWSEEELTTSFRKGIAQLAIKRKEEFSQTLDALRDYYDGYLFAKEGHRLYNPFSVLLAIKNQEIEPYWFESGTPTFLIKRVKASRIELPTLNHQYCRVEEMRSVGIETINPVAIMFQTGYLTIESYDAQRERYTLRFPNMEVRLGFARSLYPLYVTKSLIPNSPFSIFKFQDDLYDGDPESYMKRLQTLIKDLPYDDNDESSYRSIVWLLNTLSSTPTTAERHSYRGRSDLEVTTPDYIYIFEFKYNGSAAAAMEQLKRRDYAGRYAMDERRLYLIGANFSDKGEARGLTEWQIEKLE